MAIRKSFGMLKKAYVVISIKVKKTQDQDLLFIKISSLGKTGLFYLFDDKFIFLSLITNKDLFNAS